MIWTDHILKEAERLTATNTTAEIASVYGVKPCTMRKALSDYGIASARRKREGKDRKLARKYRSVYGWSILEIMEQLDRSYRFVKGCIDDQMRMWDEERFTVDPPPMRVVHRHQKSKNKPGVQLSLDLFIYSKAEAA